MSTPNKTKETTVQVMDFIQTFVQQEQKQQDSYRLMALLQEWSGYKPVMWGPSIIGFGKYHYQYASGHEGDAPLLGFSPRKAAFTLYVHVPGQVNQELLDQLGKFRISKACIYFKKLEDLNLNVLEKLCKETLQYMRSNYQCA